MKTIDQNSIISKLTPGLIHNLTTIFLGKPDTYVEEFIERIKRTETEAIYSLASGIFRNYPGVNEDKRWGLPMRSTISASSLETCVELYMIAAEKEHVLAQVELAQLLDNPDLFCHDKDKAEIYFRKAAEAGNPEAQFAVAMTLQPFVFADPSDSNDSWLEWCRLAAEQGHVGAQAELGSHYSNYNPGPRDPREAAKWHQMAAGSGDEWSIKESAVLFFELAEESREEEDYARARHWSKLTMDECSLDNDEYHDFAAIGKNLQMMLAKGLGGGKDQEAAKKYGRKYSELALSSISARENEPSDSSHEHENDLGGEPDPRWSEDENLTASGDENVGYDIDDYRRD